MAGALQKGDERILGDGEFVEQVLAQAKETFERKYRLKLRGVALSELRSELLKFWISTSLSSGQGENGPRL